MWLAIKNGHKAHSVEGASNHGRTVRFRCKTVVSYSEVTDGRGKAKCKLCVKADRNMQKAFTKSLRDAKK